MPGLGSPRVGGGQYLLLTVDQVRLSTGASCCQVTDSDCTPTIAPDIAANDRPSSGAGDDSTMASPSTTAARESTSAEGRPLSGLTEIVKRGPLDTALTSPMLMGTSAVGPRAAGNLGEGQMGPSGLAGLLADRCHIGRGSG